MATLDQLNDAVKKRECILFLGAGVHYPPPEDLPRYDYPVAERPPLGNDLCRTLAEDSLRKMRGAAEAIPPSEKEYQARQDDLSENEQYITKHISDLQRISWFYQLKH